MVLGLTDTRRLADPTMPTNDATGEEGRPEEGGRAMRARQPPVRSAPPLPSVLVELSFVFCLQTW